MRSDVQQTLSALANSSSNIKRFNTSILVKPNGKDESDVNTWSRQLTNAHTIMALHALGGESPFQKHDGGKARTSSRPC